MLPGAQMLFGEQVLPYDAEVEYLGSGGYSWIDTGLPILNNTGYQVEVSFRFTSFASGGGSEDWVFGYWNWTPTPHRIYLIGRYVNYIRCGVGLDNSEYYCQIERDTYRHTMSLMNDGAYVDGMRMCPTALDMLPNPWDGFPNVILGKSPHVDYGSPRQIFSCRMWSLSGELLRDFIPVKFTNESGILEGAFYDRANPMIGMNPDGSVREDGIYRNVGTVAFTIGPDVT